MDSTFKDNGNNNSTNAVGHLGMVEVIIKLSPELDERSRQRPSGISQTSGVI